MIKTNVLISSDGKETGALLKDILTQRGIYSPRGEATVCYGLSSGGDGPAINGRCQSDKITRMKAMSRNGVQLVPWAIGKDAHDLKLPLYARKSRGFGAKDLMPVFQREEIDWRIAAGWDWFSSVVPIAHELRCWIWRGELLDTYEKRMDRPQDYRAMGRNFGQGFEFALVKERNQATRQAILAVDSLGLDFGAVDLIIEKGGDALVLEVNTAPGVIRSGAQATLEKLADRIEGWCRADCPAR